MATLNLQKKKMMSESNYKRLVNILVGLMASQSTIESQCLFPYDETKTYSKNMICLYQNHLYLCKAATTGVFNPNAWELQDDSFTELDLDTIKSYLNLSQQDLDNLQNLIDDAQITLTKTYSSSKIYMDIQAAIAECKDDTLKQIAKKVSGSYKIATSTAEVTSADYIYLINNGSNYDLYVLVEGNPTKVGDTSIDLSDYAKLTDLDNYLKKTDADGKYATITTVDGKVDKTSILTANSSSATDDQVYSAKVMNTELDGVVKKTDIKTTLDKNSTNDDVYGGKAIFDAIHEPILMTLSSASDITALLIKLRALAPGTNATIKLFDDSRVLFPVTGNYIGTVSVINGNEIIVICVNHWNSEQAYTFRVQNDDTSISLNKICTTSVADVPVTNITTKLASTKVALDNSDSYATYYVKSGTCYVTIWSLRLIEACSVETIFNGLPKSTIGVTCPLCNGVESFAQVFMSPNSGVIAFNANASLVNKSGYCSFTYPVLES